MEATESVKRRRSESAADMLRRSDERSGADVALLADEAVLLTAVVVVPAIVSLRPNVHAVLASSVVVRLSNPTRTNLHRPSYLCILRSVL